MRVAVVFRGIGPESGGEYTFAAALLRATRTIEPQTSHSFIYYSTGRVADTDINTLPVGRRAVARRATVRLFREVGDRLGVSRPYRTRTWFECSLEAHGVEFVWFASNYAEECHLPYIFTVLDIEYLRQPWFPEVSSRGEWERRHQYFSQYIPKATRVVVPNQTAAQQLTEGWGISPARLLSLHHPTPDYALDAANRSPVPPYILHRHGVRKPYLFYPAQLWPHKNHVVLLEALAELNRAKRDRFELVCAGSRSPDHIKRVARELGVADAVHVLGFVSRPELIALYQNAHALTFMSLFGPENLPPLEAMALGCPAVIADIPGAAEQVGDAALRVSPTDPCEIADAIRAVNEPETRRRLIAAGRDLARKRTSAAYVRGVLHFLDEFEQVRRMWQ